MNCHNRNWVRTTRWPLAAMVLLCGAGLMVQAGDPILFPGQKGKLDLGKQDPASKQDLLRSSELSKLPAYEGPSDARPGPSPSRSPVLDAKTARRLENGQIEKKNWAFVNPGDLQNKGEGTLGVREFSLDGLEKQGNNRDLTFKDVGVVKPASSLQKPITLREREAEDATRKIVLPGSPEAQLGAHKNSDLDLRSSFSGLDLTTSTLGPDQSANLSERNVLGGIAPARVREPLGRKENLEASPSLSAMPPLPSGVGDPINLPNDLSRQPLNPLVGKSTDLPGRTPGLDAMPSGRDLGRPANSFASPGGTDSARGIGGYSSLPSPYLRGADQTRSAMPSSFEAPRRKF